MEQSPTRFGVDKKPKRFNDEKIKRNLQSFHLKRLTPPPKRTSDSSQGTVVATTSPEAKGILPRLTPTESIIRLPEYTLGLKRLSALGAFLAGLCILIAFAEGEVTAAKENEWSVLADAMRVVNICVGAAEVVLTVKFYNTRLRVRIAQGEIDDRLDRALWPFYFVELLFCVLLTPPGLYFTFRLPSQNPSSSLLSLTELVFGLTSLRVYFLIKFLYWRLCSPRDDFHL